MSLARILDATLIVAFAAASITADDDRPKASEQEELDSRSAPIVAAFEDARLLMMHSAAEGRWDRVTIVCVWLAYQANEAHQLSCDLKAIKSMGGFVEYAHQFPGGEWRAGKRDDHASVPAPNWLRQAIGDEYFVRPVGLQFWEKPVVDADLACVGRLHDLRYLSFMADGDGPKIQGHGLEFLRNLDSLRYLDLPGHLVGDDHLSALADLDSLEYLDLRSTRVTDAGLAQLATLPKLRFLALDNTDVTDAGLASLAALHDLETVLVRNTKVTPEGVAALQLRLPNCNVKLSFPKSW